MNPLDANLLVRNLVGNGRFFRSAAISRHPVFGIKHSGSWQPADGLPWSKNSGPLENSVAILGLDLGRETHQMFIKCPSLAIDIPINHH